MKAYEATGGKLDPHLSNYAGIDSRAFSTFTRDMTRPFDVQRGGCLRMTLCVMPDVLPCLPPCKSLLNGTLEKLVI